ncbi:hypothetical protein V5799_016877 [Amblyomma americanum]|uniref:Uncharacterized protein n=1 Tax=Amblyomma americanum TaxID=6943 RepID=A0AAQ4F4X5_AMBAM
MLTTFTVANSALNAIAYSPGDVNSLKAKSPTVTKVDWHQLTCTLNPDIVGIWDNEHLTDVVNLTCNRSHNKAVVAAGDRAGFLRIFRFPCTNTKVSLASTKRAVRGVALAPSEQDASRLSAV